jgi:Tol biopolymer transport system component
MRKIFGLMVLGMLLTGCATAEGDVGSPEPFPKATTTETAIPSITSTFTPEPTPTITPTPLPSPTLSPTPGPTPTGGAKWIAFSIVKRVLGAYESQGVYRMAVNGSELELILEPGHTLLGISPSGLRMLVSAGSSLYVMGTDASNQRLLTDKFYDLGNDNAYWTSDEHKIVYIEGDGTDNVVYVGHPDSSEQVRISQDDLNPIEVFPTLDASGVFWCAGSCISEGDCTREALIWSSIDGTIQRTMREEINRPIAAPMGDIIAYFITDALGRSQLEVAALDGSLAELIYVYGSHYMDYGWSPRGSQLAVIVADRSAYSGIITGYRYYIVNTARNASDVLSWPLGENTNLVWSPDGLRILLSGTGQTDTGFHINMTVYDLFRGQGFEVQDWEIFTSTDYVFIPRAYWIP